MLYKLKRNVKRKYATGGLVEGLVEGAHKLIDWWTGSSVPPKVANFLKEHGDEKITSLVVGRAPIWKTLDLAVDIMSGGKFGQIKKKVGIDKLFHLFLIVNNKWIFEKNDLFNIANYSKQKDEENMSVPFNKDITISEFLKKASSGNEVNFYRNYNAFKNNCQDMIVKLLRSNGLLNEELSKFIKQDIEELVEGVGGDTVETSKEVTDTGGLINRLLQLVSGGKLSFARGTRNLKRRVRKGLV
jgi:hypothetical protein